MQTTGFIVRKRIATLFFFFVIIFLLLGSRVFWVQFVKGAELSEKALQNRMRDVPVESKRGIIYDRNGNELAISVSADSVYAIPAEVCSKGQQKEIAAKLAQVLEMDEESLLRRISRNSSFEWVKRQIDPEKSKIIRKMDLPGIGLTEESRRYYPKGTLASHVLGIAGIDNNGLEGVDFYYDKLVGGTKGRIIIEHDAVNRPIPEATHKFIPPVDGANLILTIDESIQYITERELDKVFNERKAKSAAAIIMDVSTGEILALASRPTFDPNDFSAYPASNRRNYGINDSYEPGSTMKITTAAMALQEGVVNAESRFYCPGYIKVGKEVIGCPDRKPHGSQSFAQTIEKSCNVAFIQIGLELGLENYYKYLKTFGFGQKTGIDLPGEAEGILIPRASAQQIELATMAMGQANAVTPIQLLTAVGAVANEGKLMKPHILKQVIDDKGNVIKKVEPQVVRQVISPETARELCGMLEGEVVNGTGRNAYLEGYKVAGKTGTAQKVGPDRRYMSNEHVASFVGFAPADQPKLLSIVVVDAPKGYPYYGGWVAAPAFREILKDSFNYLEIPRYNSGKDEQSIEQKEQLIVPDVVNLPVSEASSLIKSRGLRVEIDGNGTVVWQQTPRAHSKVERDSAVIIHLSPFEGGKEGAEVTIPDLQGKSMKEVARILADLGLHLVPEGYGLAYQQVPEAGKVVTSGSSIRVKFQPVGE
ncbi:MAG: stage V sporulation protein D [Syntrophomonas sp.]|uniref:stage V sporulation protein D n=1 Tax=Syntrophomonas sp. TaxID=2053627 RepID=UPI00260602DD|nr:stage V sporulation protein D [Syntrophomonas sp.]MDD2509643.1 stage V sporulation protein D [Syntrophomonas sp.]MDD3878958.1 stage V sporulation protein D [Syntrophomonas sp.]MDD4625695.1 stage V sporulation protein D [Syntrophomonas sp.]